MKTPAFAFAALLALSGAAFAGDAAIIHHPKATVAVSDDVAKTLDRRPTGSVRRSADADAADAAEAGGEASKRAAKLGIDVSPVFVPPFN